MDAVIQNSSFIVVETIQRGRTTLTVERSPTGLCLLTAKHGRRVRQRWYRTEQAALVAALSV